MRFYFAFCLLIAMQVIADEKKTIYIAAIDWCPQLCPVSDREGYIREIVERVYTDTAYTIEITTYPWSRALKMVHSGEVDAVLSPAKAEAPNLRYPKKEIGIQRMCFFTLAKNTWVYEGYESLTGLQFGMASDTSLEELNSYVEKHPEQFQTLPYHERYILQQARMLKRGRIDAFLFTYNSTRYELQQSGQWPDFKNAGCVSNAKVYMAFTPNTEKQTHIQIMMNTFDDRMGSLIKEDIPRGIMMSYGLEYWAEGILGSGKKPNEEKVLSQ